MSFSLGQASGNDLKRAAEIDHQELLAGQPFLCGPIAFQGPITSSLYQDVSVLSLQG